MNLVAGSLVVFSAFIHAFWNYSSKSRGATVAYFFMAVATSGVVLSPMLYFYRDLIPRLSPIFWVLVVLTGAFQTLYFASLISAYQTGDLSVAYPLLRAIPVILVAFISLVMNDGSAPSKIGWIGILLVAMGCLCLPLLSFRKVRLTNYLTISCFFALLAGLGTTGYSLVDNRALSLLLTMNGDGLAKITNALFYLEVQLASTFVFMAAYMAVSRAERVHLLENFSGHFWQAAQTGLLVSLTYGLVLVAMTLATSVSYIVAFRQLSIPIGGIFGMVFQKESHPLPRVFGIGFIFIGLVLVAIA